MAGPVVAAAVVLHNPDCLPHLNDSKLLPADARLKLFDEILENASAMGVGIVPPETIDQINILQATRLAMSRAVMEISPLPDYLLVDGTISLDLSIPQQAIIKGDRLCFSVAAAGIVAKVTRDKIMVELHEQFPQYGFAQHKGYGTRDHKEAIARCGPSPVHRMCFRGVKEPDLPLFCAELHEED